MKPTREDQLSDEQQRALTALTGGSVAVIAGPGSGKTHTLTSAVRQTVRTEPSARVLCLTFTNKSADNLKQRLPAHSKLFVGTFHALAAKLLPTDDNHTIAAPETLYSLLASLRRSQSLREVNVRELGLLVSKYKNGSLNTVEAQRLTSAYDKELQARGCMDYDDLILQALEQAAACVPYDYLFVDEFQDTSPKQYELLQRLSAAHTKLFVIGDPKQSIYRFRGADGSVFDRLLADSNAQSVTLTRNYRSSLDVVAAANRIFDDQPPQRAEQRLPGSVTTIETLDEYSEPNYIATQVQQALGGTEWQHTHHDAPILHAGSFSDFAVLYRTRRQGELLARKLRQAGLPLQCLGEDSPYASPIMRLLEACLTYLIEPDDDGKRAIIQAAAVAKLAFKPSQLLMVDPALAPPALVAALADNLGQADSEAALLLGNVASRFVSVTELVAHLQSLAEQAFFDPQADAVCLSTIHASKGLEFRHVYVTGCNDGLLPSRRADGEEGLAEERRLFYVAVTRARESLTVLRTRTWSGKPAQRSPFVALLGVEERTDPSLAATERTRSRQRQKRAQQRLF